MTVLVDRAGLAAFGTDATAAVERARLELADTRATLEGATVSSGAASTAAVLADVEHVLASLTGLLAWPPLLADAFGRLDDAMSADGDLASLLRDTHDTDRADRAQVAAVLPDLPPRVIARVWTDLPPADRAWLERRHRALVGGLDGIPPEVRDRCNRAAVQAHLDELRAELHEWRGGPPPLAGPLAADGRTVLSARITRIEGLLDADRILVFDPSGDGRAVVALGDPASAHHVATIVPGIGTSLDTMPRLVREASTVRTAARAVDDDVATIAWLGYDPPPGMLEAGARLTAHDPRPLVAAATRFVADRDQQALVDHAAGLRVVNPDVHHTVIGHSYGSVLALRAIKPGGPDAPLDVDDLVVLGSPGAGRDVDDVADLAWPEHVGAWSARAWADPVPHLPGVLGPAIDDLDPSVHRLPTDARNVGHGRYFVAGSGAVAAMAVVVAGRPRRAPSRVHEVPARRDRPATPTR